MRALASVAVPCDVYCSTNVALGCPTRANPPALGGCCDATAHNSQCCPLQHVSDAEAPQCAYFSAGIRRCKLHSGSRRRSKAGPMGQQQDSSGALYEQPAGYVPAAVGGNPHWHCTMTSRQHRQADRYLACRGYKADRSCSLQALQLGVTRSHRHNCKVRLQATANRHIRQAYLPPGAGNAVTAPAAAHHGRPEAQGGAAGHPQGGALW
jgi:hypothetical protein